MGQKEGGWGYHRSEVMMIDLATVEFAVVVALLHNVHAIIVAAHEGAHEWNEGAQVSAALLLSVQVSEGHDDAHSCPSGGG